MPTKTIVHKVAGRTYSVDVPTIERVPGEIGIAAAVALAADAAVAAAVAEGPPSAAGFVFIRRALGLTAARLGELLGVRAETISRWENEVAAFDRTDWLALGDLALERAGRPPAALARMEALADGKQPPKQIRVELAAVPSV
jgi:hypothetical protein